MRRTTRLQLVHVVRQGWNLSLVALRTQAPLPVGRLFLEPWPAVAMLEDPRVLLSSVEMSLAA